MSGTALCVAAILLGVNFDIRTLPTGGVEYIIFVAPLDLKSLESGSDLHSDVPPGARDVRSFSIRLIKEQQSGVGPSPAFALPTTDSRPTAPSPLFNAPELAPPGGGKFPNVPSTVPPLPKLVDDRRSPDKEPARPATFEQPPLGPSTPPTSKPFRPMTEAPGSAVTAKLPNDSKGSKEPALPAAEKPQPPKASSQTGAQTVGPEPVQDSQGLLYGLAAGTAGSFSGMIFFGWVAWDYRRRYYSLLSRGGQTPGMSEWESMQDDSEEEDPPVSADD